MISDLLSVIQLLATLTIGFAILGYSDFFYDILKTKFFHADDTIAKAVEECRTALPDKTSMDNLIPTDLGKGNTASKIEELKRNCEKVGESITEFEKKFKKELSETCCTRSLTSMCLFIFFESVILLFVPLTRALYNNTTELFLLPFSALCILYLVFGWFCGEKNLKLHIAKFDSLMHPAICTLVFSILSIGFALWQNAHSSMNFGELWKYLVVVLVLLGWVNFLIYAIFIRRSIDRFRIDVERSKSDILEKCKEAQKSYTDLQTVASVASMISAQ